MAFRDDPELGLIIGGITALVFTFSSSSTSAEPCGMSMETSGADTELTTANPVEGSSLIKDVTEAVVIGGPTIAVGASALLSTSGTGGNGEDWDFDFLDAAGNIVGHGKMRDAIPYTKLESRADRIARTFQKKGKTSFQKPYIIVKDYEAFERMRILLSDTKGGIEYSNLDVLEKVLERIGDI